VIYGSKENTWETVTVIYWMTTLVHIWQIWWRRHRQQSWTTLPTALT
jgi:hypothetical protein